jgi:hypothetical protein
MPVGLMSGVHLQVVPARANDWILSAEWRRISGWWQGAAPFVPMDGPLTSDQKGVYSAYTP